MTGVNRVAVDVPDLSLLYGCNYEWWRAYWHLIAEHKADKWSTNARAAQEFGVNWIAERDAPGLSTDPSIIHHGHGSGYSLVNLVFLMGAKRIILLGYDLKYPRDYDGRARFIGTGRRHYWADRGGEYEPQLQHWPSVHVAEGVHYDLVRRYGEIAKQGVIEITNCTPNSAIECFPMMDIADA